MIHKLLVLVCFLVVTTSLAGCNRVLLHSKDKELEAVSQTFSVGTEEALKAAKEAAISLGYTMEREESAGFKTKWQSTRASSHYLDLFGRKDYGTVGAYYQLVVQVADKDGKAEVSVSAPIRGVITRRLYSSNREEKKVLKKMTNLLRKDDFEITNVGTSE